MTRRSRIAEMSFREVFGNPPAIVERTRRKKGAAAARRQQTAIALNKARKRGARIPRR